MRYNVGEELLVVHFKMKGTDPFNGKMFHRPYFFSQNNNDVITETKIIKLTVTEHHRVSDGYTDEKKYDGYVLKDENGNEYLNQYPYASYGQVSDTADGSFVLRVPDDAGLPYIESLEGPYEFYLLSRFMDDLYSFLKDGKPDNRELKNIPLVQRYNKIQKLHDSLLSTLKKTFNIEAKQKPIWENTPSITHYVFDPLLIELCFDC